MIIVRLIGGLGNQLFQYAAARRLAHVNKVQLKVDISGFETYTLHKYSLQHYNIQAETANAEEVALFNRELKRSKISRFFFDNIVGEDSPFQLLKEAHFHLDSRLLSAGGNVLLDGYWQSEKYFTDIAGLIRAEFTVKTESDSVNRAAAEEIDANNSVSLHIRRADYVTNSATNSIHGVCSDAYYRKAVETIAGHIRNPHFYIFSDDPDWVAANFKLDYAMSIVSHNNADKNYEDLRLMSLCKGNIIANSSFSWWGAWLNPDRHKVVIAPGRWFNSDGIDTSDLIPPGWLCL